MDSWGIDALALAPVQKLTNTGDVGLDRLRRLPLGLERNDPWTAAVPLGRPNRHLALTVDLASDILTDCGMLRQGEAGDQ
jgi:hypothetical protein